MGFNKHFAYLKFFAFTSLIGYGFTFSSYIWEGFKDWAMERKAKKVIAAIEKGFCLGDLKCSEALAPKLPECTKMLAEKRSDRSASEFNGKDRRMALGCLHKNYMAYSCQKKSDPAKQKACDERVATRHDQCFNFVFDPQTTEIPEGMGSNMVGCLYGVMFVQDDSAGPGMNVEESMLKKKKRRHLKPLPEGRMPSLEEIDELKEAIAEMGAERIDNFNEAMDALQEMRGGAAVDNSEAVNVFDKSGESIRRSAGIGVSAGESGDREPSSDAQLNQ